MCPGFFFGGWGACAGWGDAKGGLHPPYVRREEAAFASGTYPEKEGRNP